MSKKINGILLKGSLRDAPDQLQRLKVTPQSKSLHFHAQVREGSTNLPALAAAVKNGLLAPMDAEQIAATVGYVSEDVLEKVKTAFVDAGFEVGNFDPLTGLLEITGSAQMVRLNFGATLNEFQDEEGTVFTARRGVLSLPRAWGVSQYVKAIHGIDQRPKARPLHMKFGTRDDKDTPPGESGKKPNDGDKKPTQGDDAGDPRHPHGNLARSWNARAVAEHYGVPLSKQGAGFAVGFVSLGGGLDPAVCTKANARLGLPAPKITIITVDGAKNSPSGSLDGADGENYLDAQCQAGVAPLAEQIMAIGPNSITGFANALLALAKHDKKPSKISISWGAREDGEWTDNDRALFDQALQICMAMGITVFCAAGDDGSSDGASDGKAHCDYPASSPWNTACSGVWDNGSSVKAWKSMFGGATGGGVSSKYPNYTDDQIRLQKAGIKLPVHADTGKPGRVVGDIAGIADPSTGIEVYGPNGAVSVIGGTSAVSPFHAGACVALESDLGKRIPNLNGIVYRLAAEGKNVCMPVTKGNNGAYSCNDGDIFNAVCGLGPVDYAKLFAALKAGV